MTDEAETRQETFTIMLPAGMNCDDTVKALAERYLGVAGGDPVIAVLLACEDVMMLRGAASHGMMHGRKLTVDEV